jgi:hypothetical protein
MVAKLANSMPATVTFHPLALAAAIVTANELMVGVGLGDVALAIVAITIGDRRLGDYRADRASGGGPKTPHFPLVNDLRGCELRRATHERIWKTPMSDEAFDAAISFLVRDEATATDIAERLEGAGLKVFFFPHRQEELAGTNGMESMRAPFLMARVNVVLFRKPWGETPWTRVEDGAISERCFKGGWSSLMFVELEKAPLPKWLPSTHIRFAFADYGIDQLVGAIKFRVQEQGGTIKPLDALARAKAVKSEADYLADRNRLMRDGVWIGRLHDSIRETLAEIGVLARKLKEEHGLDVAFGTRDRMGILRAGFVSIGIGWKQPIFNCVGDYDRDECHLRVAEFSGLLVMPGENMWYPEQPRLQREWKFKVDVAHDRSLVWRLPGKNEQIPASQLADRIVRIFLDLVSRANRGEVEPPH